MKMDFSSLLTIAAMALFCGASNLNANDLNLTDSAADNIHRSGRGGGYNSGYGNYGYVIEEPVDVAPVIEEQVPVIEEDVPVVDVVPGTIYEGGYYGHGHSRHSGHSGHHKK